MNLRFSLGLALSVSMACAQADTPPAGDEPALEEQLLVVASRLPTASSETGRAVAVLDEAALKNLGFGYGADLLRYLPGLAVSRSGGYGGATQLRVRGSEANHLVVLIDGVDASSAGTGEFDFSSLLSADIERVELLRGPQSGLYGSNALAGVLNIQTRTPSDGLAADITLEGGDDSIRHTGVSVSGGSERLKGRLSFAQRESEFDLSTNDALGAEDDSDENTTVSGRAEWAVSDVLTVSLVGRHNDRETETDGFDFSGGPLTGVLVDDASATETEDLTLGVAATLRVADGRGITRLAYERNDSELDAGGFGNEAEREQLRFDGSWFWQTGAREQRTTLFVQREEESYRNTVPFDPSQARTQTRDMTAIGVEHRFVWDDALFLTGTLRRDNNDDFENETTYALDASYRWADAGTRVHASFGTGVTNPTFLEQFGFIPGTFIGNPDLVPESSRGWDLGVEQAFLDGALLVDVTYFDADLEDEIQSLFTTVANADGESDRKGGELTLTYRPTAATTVHAAYTYTDAQDPAGEEVRRAEHVASLGAAHALMDGRLRLAGSVLYNGAQLDTDFRTFSRVELDSFTLVNLNASFAVSDKVEAYVRLENVFDEDYEEVIGYAAPGRVALAGVRLRLGR